jgi:hypothetical protein
LSCLVFDLQEQPSAGLQPGHFSGVSSHPCFLPDLKELSYQFYCKSYARSRVISEQTCKWAHKQSYSQFKSVLRLTFLLYTFFLSVFRFFHLPSFLLRLKLRHISCVHETFFKIFTAIDTHLIYAFDILSSRSTVLSFPPHK